VSSGQLVAQQVAPGEVLRQLQCATQQSCDMSGC
jgi:hypothetical protein